MSGVSQEHFDLLKDNLTNSSTSININHNKVHRGRFYACGDLFTSVADNGYAQILLINGHSAELHMGFTVTGEGKGYFQAKQGVSYSAPGTALTVINKNTNPAAPAASMLAYKTPISVTGGNQLHPLELLTGGEGPRTIGKETTKSQEVILRPGGNFYLEFQNKAGATKDVSLLIEFYTNDIFLATTTTSTTTTTTTTTA